jgi:hypothetical protein
MVTGAFAFCRSKRRENDAHQRRANFRADTSAAAEGARVLVKIIAE